MSEFDAPRIIAEGAAQLTRTALEGVEKVSGLVREGLENSRADREGRDIESDAVAAQQALSETTPPMPDLPAPMPDATGLPQMEPDHSWPETPTQSTSHKDRDIR
jgi:hypothetical protein